MNDPVALGRLGVGDNVLALDTLVGFRDRNRLLLKVEVPRGEGQQLPVLRSLSTRRKLRKNMVKQQIQGYLFNKSTKYGERRCA